MKKENATANANFFDKKHFDAFTIEDENSLRRIVREYNDLDKKSRTASILKAIEKKISDYNNDLFTAKVDEFSGKNGNDLFAYLFTVPATVAENDKKTAKEVYNAVSATRYTFKVDDSGKAIIKKGMKPVTVQDIHRRKADIYGASHADGKPTKDDKKKALDDMFTADAKGALVCWTYSACKFESIRADDDAFTANKFALATMADMEKKYTANGKENPFTLVSKGASQDQLRETITAMASADIAEKFIKKHALTLYKKTCYVNKQCVEVIEDMLGIAQALAILARYAYNGIALPANDKSGIFTVEEEDESIIC